MATNKFHSPSALKTLYKLYSSLPTLYKKNTFRFHNLFGMRMNWLMMFCSLLFVEGDSISYSNQLKLIRRHFFFVLGNLGQGLYGSQRS